MIFLRLGAVFLALLALNFVVGSWVRSLELTAETLAHLHRGMWITALVYAALLAVPFVPGVEIGIGLLAMFGSAGAGPVYVATLLGLTLAFTAGRLLPISLIIQGAALLGLTRLSELLTRIEPLDHRERLAILAGSSGDSWRPWLLRHRYIALAILLNIPGNALIGGGGGIALVAGLSRLFPPAVFLAVICLAVAPIPLAAWVFGGDILDPLK